MGTYSNDIGTMIAHMKGYCNVKNSSYFHMYPACYYVPFTYTNAFNSLQLP